MPAPRRSRLEDRDTLMRAAETAHETGDFATARDLARRAVDAADREPEGNSRAAARRILARALLYTHGVDDARRVAREAVRIARAAHAPKERAQVELALSEIERSSGDFVAALRHAARARLLAARSHDIPTLRSVLAEVAWLVSGVGDAERGREIMAEALALPEHGQRPARAFRVLYNAARLQRTAGRFEEALRTLDRADELAKKEGLEHAVWSVRMTRAAVYVDIGALDLARDLLAHEDENPNDERRAHALMLEAAIAHAANERPERVERLAMEGLAIEGLEPLMRVSLERLRALALLARGKADEAERIAIELVSICAKRGAHAPASQAMGIAARVARPEAALLRWLGAVLLATAGVSARTEHEGLAALATEPDPIGALARTTMAAARSRLIDRTPGPLKATMKRTLRQLEARAVQQKQAKRAEFDTTLSAETLRAKEEVGLAGSSPGLVRAIATLARAAKSDTSIVITGETGSGKELFARLAHTLSGRKEGPFVAVNCAAIPEPLLEAELFGHERGAFTGAERARSGLFVEAQGGTLFLDEVGEMSPAMQAKLLRVLEEREVRAIGGSRSRKVDVRVLAATHRELSSMVTARTFREDLYYRLAAIAVRVPSLRERPEDVPSIAKALILRDPATARLRLDVPALTAIAEYPWPGNVRELANVLRAAAALAEGNVIGREELTQAMKGAARALTAAPNARSALEETNLAELRARHRAELRELVGRAIAGADGNKLRAARALGISRQGLYRVLAEIGE